MAAIAASGDSILPRGTPCWSTTASRTVRSPADRIESATSRARASRSGVARPCRPTNPGCPTPEGSMLTRVNRGRRRPGNLRKELVRDRRRSRGPEIAEHRTRSRRRPRPLCHKNHRQVRGRVVEPRRPEPSVPPVAPDRLGHPGPPGHHADPEPPPRIVETKRAKPRYRLDLRQKLVAGHQGHRRTREDTRAAEHPAPAEHPRERGVVVDRGHQTPGAR